MLKVQERANYFAGANSPEYTFARLISYCIRQKFNLLISNEEKLRLQISNLPSFDYSVYLLALTDNSQTFLFKESPTTDQEKQDQIMHLIKDLESFSQIKSIDFFLFKYSEENDFDYKGFFTDKFSAFFKKNSNFQSFLAPSFFKTCSAKIIFEKC